jgi:predicted methyltransferase
VSIFSLSAIAALAVVGCGGAAQEAPEPVAEAVVEAVPEPVGLDPAILDDPSRPMAEKDQDADRHPLEVYEFFGVQPGATVADVYNADGYNTHLLARAVGDGGTVYSVFEFYADKEAFGGQLYKVDSVTQRLAEAGINNVELAMAMSDVPADSVDVAIAVRNYHDVEHVFPTLTRVDQVAEFFRIVKPGGTVGIVEVATPNEGWHEATHRLNKQMVIDDFTMGGFELVEESDMLANPNDDHSADGFAEGRHKSDRYVLKFRKPTS